MMAQEWLSSVRLKEELMILWEILREIESMELQVSTVTRLNMKEIESSRSSRMVFKTSLLQLMSLLEVLMSKMSSASSTSTCLHKLRTMCTGSVELGELVLLELPLACLLARTWDWLLSSSRYLFCFKLNFLIALEECRVKCSISTLWVQGNGASIKIREYELI